MIMIPTTRTITRAKMTTSVATQQMMIMTMTMCTITMAELSVGPHATADPIEAARRQEQVQQAEAAFDALIASVAIANELPLYTVNPADFGGIDGLDVRAVPHPGAGVKRS